MPLSSVPATVVPLTTIALQGVRCGGARAIAFPFAQTGRRCDRSCRRSRCANQQIVSPTARPTAPHKPVSRIAVRTAERAAQTDRPHDRPHGANRPIARWRASSRIARRSDLHTLPYGCHTKGDYEVPLPRFRLYARPERRRRRDLDQHSDARHQYSDHYDRRGADRRPRRHPPHAVRRRHGDAQLFQGLPLEFREIDRLLADFRHDRRAVRLLVDRAADHAAADSEIRADDRMADRFRMGVGVAGAVRELVLAHARQRFCVRREQHRAYVGIDCD